MQNNSNVQLGKFISLILRHKPETVGIKLDDHGWADVNELINGIRKTGKNIDMSILERIVRENNKNRYSFNDDKTKIRANQGHSISVDVELEEKVPPKYLYHGTAQRFLDSIMQGGIKKQQRQYVHLSKDIETATAVGIRHGKPVVLRIDAENMHRDGYKFYLSKNMVWLTEYVPIEYIQMTNK